MKIEEIMAIEAENEDAIHLIKQSLFWQAWEKSAYHFVLALRPYKISCKEVQKIAAACVYLGFPERVLEAVCADAQKLGYRCETVNNAHIRIIGLSPAPGFDTWKAQKLKDFKAKSAQIQKAAPIDHGQSKLYFAYKTVYDLALYLTRLSTTLNRAYRFGLGEELRKEAVLLAELIQLAAQNLAPLNKKEFAQILTGVRIKLRILLDLKQIRPNQWLFANKYMEEIYSLLRLEFRSLGTTEESHSESSHPLTPADIPESRQTIGVIHQAGSTASGLTPEIISGDS